MKKILFYFFVMHFTVAGLLISGAFSEAPAFLEMSDSKFDRFTTADARLVMEYRRGMMDIIAYMKSRPDLFNAKNSDGKMSLNRVQRLSAWNTWQTFLDHILAMDALGDIYSQYYKEFDGERKKTAFRISFAAFLAQYRFAMDFIDIIERNPDFHVILNEAVPELVSCQL